ncbi:LpxK Tetraacyldisaccharide-1-P 4'-kinase [Comamonadaceae bacterium]
MLPAVQAAITRAWVSGGWVRGALTPISLIYGALTGLQRVAYRAGLLQSSALPVPVIVVGNVIAGGAGKTPTVLGVVAHLLAQGHRPGIISRGYGGSHQEPTPVTQDSPAALVGDEPLLLHRKSGVPVVVGRDRVAAGRSLLDLYPGTTHVVCDDGLQHYRLRRDIEICVFDARGLGNGGLLPAGPLRQAWPRALVATAGQAESRTLTLHTGTNTLAGFLAQRSLATTAINAAGQTTALSSLQRSQRPLHAVAGIAQPENFFSMLRAQGLTLASTDALPDHYDFHSYSRNKYAGKVLICTEKDATKLWQHWPDAWSVPLIQTLPPDFLAALDTALQDMTHASVSFPHGHTTH